MMNDLNTFEKKIDVAFKDKTLLKKAFIHRSYLNEHKEEKLEHNERLEFLGDAVLELVTTEHLFNVYADKSEGELTSIRAALVNTNTLADVAHELDMEKYILLSKGQAKDMERSRQYILANTFEAFIGALYIDQGYDRAKDFIIEHLMKSADEIVEKELWRDSKSTFQEKAQENTGITPRYEIRNESGPDHDKSFVVGVYLDDELIAEGEGKSKQIAEQSAASKALEIRGW